MSNVLLPFSLLSRDSVYSVFGDTQGGVNREFPGALGCEDRMRIEGPPWSLGS